MKFICFYFTLILFCAGNSSAQNYSIISPEYKTWFNNAKGYLKGMRIDSVHVGATEKVHYPFHTARLRAENAFYADTLGGSWLGKTIIENMDGSGTSILNKWGDTVFIKNDAVLNESWVLYHDTSAVFIKATVVSVDTMSMANISDSVKIIRLTVMNGNTEQVGDSLNNLELILSKEHGFFQAIELYLLPFHEPGNTAYDAQIDMYLKEYLNAVNWEFIRANLTFRRVAYNFPNERKIYDYHTGDVMIRRTHTNYWELGNYREERDSIVLSTGMGDSLQVEIAQSYHVVEFQMGTEVVLYSGTNHYFRTYHSRPVFPPDDTAKMSEEWFTTDYLYFIEHDSSFCHTSNVYLAYNHFLNSNGENYQFEQSRNSVCLKEGLGVMRIGNSSFPAESRHDVYLRGARKNGQFCGPDNLALSIGEDLSSDLQANVYPNPVNDYLLIDCNEDVSLSVSLTDLSGRELVRNRTGKRKLKINVSNLPPGLYLLNTKVGVHNIVRKIIVQH
jgi:hypothetical protein